ncbi:MAG: glycosyltransferase family 9 protein [Longimicrobiaceae bacterium]
MSLRYPADRVCIVLLTGLGDVVHGLPVANALKRDDPRRHLTWVVEPMPGEVLRHHPAIDEIVVFEKRRGWRGVRDLWRQLRARRFDLTLNLNIYAKSIFPTLLSGAPHRLGFERARTRDGVWLASNHHLDPRPRWHTQEMFLEFLDHLGLRDYAVEWRITFTEEERRAQAEFFGRLDGRRVAALVVASARAEKDWFADRWAAVADALERDFGYQVLLVGGPSERERRIAHEIQERSHAQLVPALGEGVRRIAWTLKGSDLVIAPDTGPLHIARALEVPVIGLFGHTNPLRVGPWQSFAGLWVDRYHDEGVEPNASEDAGRAGRMERITVDDVLDRVQRAMARYGGTAPRHRPGS